MAMSSSEWSTQEEYIALYGTQEQQAAKQCKAKHVVDGPWRLVRQIPTPGGSTKAPLDNSVRSTSAEIENLRDREYERTGIVWTIEKYC